MGALETLYQIVYGTSPGESGGNPLEAENRLKLYAIEKLLQSGNVLSDYHDSINDDDLMRRARENPSFDEKYLSPEKREAINYWRREFKKNNISPTRNTIIPEFLEDAVSNSSPGRTQLGVGPGTSTTAPEVASAVGAGGASSSSTIKNQTSGFNPQEWDKAISSVMNWEDQYNAEQEAERAANAVVDIGVPGGDAGRARIIQQAGGRPGSGSFSQMGSTITGGDSPEDLRRFVDEDKANSINRQIELIENMGPPQYRSQQVQDRLNTLYQAQAERDATSVNRERLGADYINAEANMLQAEGMYNSYTETPKATRYGHDIDYKIAELNYNKSNEIEASRAIDAISETLVERAKKMQDPRAYAAATAISAINSRDDLTISEKQNEVAKILQKSGFSDVSSISDINLATPSGEDELDLLLYGNIDPNTAP